MVKKFEKPPVITAGDSTKFGQPGAFEALRALAEVEGWTTGFVVFTAASHFAPRKPREVSAAEIEAALPELVFRGKAIKAAKAAETRDNGRPSDVRDRMDADCQEKWGLGRWRGHFPIRVLLEKYPTGGLTTALLDGLAAELKAKKAADEAVVNERPDPDPIVAGKPMPCAASRHGGSNPLEVVGSRNKVERGNDGQLHTRRHPGSNEEIVSGDFLKLDEFEGELPPGMIRVEEAGAVIFGRPAESRHTPIFGTRRTRGKSRGTRA